MVPPEVCRSVGWLLMEEALAASRSMEGEQLCPSSTV